MTELITYRLEDPWYLLLLLVIPAYLWFQSRNKEANRLNIPSIEALRNASLIKSILLKILPWIFCIGLVFMILALSRPQQVLTEEVVKAEGIDIFLAMDVSSSMLSRDFEPDRLTVSKQVAIDFVRKRPYDRIGVVVFAGEAYTQSPLTTDKNVLEDFLTQINVGVLTDGTAIGMGLAAGVNRLKDSDANSKVIILLTDGVNNGGYIAPEMAAELAKKFGIRVYTIGVGSEGMAMSPVGIKKNGEFLFNMARVQIDEELLRDISRQTNGAYFRATNAEVLRRVYEEIDQLEKTELDITVYKRYKDLYLPFLWSAFVIWLIYLGIKHLYLRIWPV